MIIRNYVHLQNLVYYLQIFLEERNYILNSNDLESYFHEK